MCNLFIKLIYYSQSMEIQAFNRGEAYDHRCSSYKTIGKCINKEEVAWHMVGLRQQLLKVELPLEEEMGVSEYSIKQIE